jgi:superfamily I DNA/RNA helicase
MEMNVLCDECRIARNQKIKSGEWQSSRKYGAVLLDEAQIIESESVKMIFELTGQAYPYRDFYMFCDEEQAMRGAKDILASDSETKKMIVKAPDKGFGRFVTLKSHYRALNEDLLNVFKAIQGMLSAKYDTKELGMELPIENMQPSLAIHVAFAVVCKENVDIGDWDRWIKPDLEANSDGGDVLLMIDDEVKVRQFYKEIKSKGTEEEKKWVVTHKEVKNREEEKNLRRSFYKDRDKVHLSTVDCAQGQTFDNVVLVVTHNDTGNIEELFSGMTRARKTLRIVDASPNQWVYKMLKQYNSYEVKVVEDVSEKTFQRFNVDDIPF